MTFPRQLLLLAVLAALQAARSPAEESPKNERRYPFRTDFANVDLPWYEPKNLEFPPHHSDRRISGELVSADFIHRTGQFRASKTGELVDFTMPPYGSISYLNAEADLRDVPLGTCFLFFLHQDGRGNFTRLATMQEQFTMDASHSFTYRLDGVKAADGRLLTTKQSLKKNQPDLGNKELLVKPETRLWKGEQQVKLGELAVGDELLFNLTGRLGDNPGWCTDIWVGAETHQAATERQRQKFAEFVKKRGLPGWIENTEGNQLTFTLFSGDAASFKQTYLEGFEVGKELQICVANDELRTWNPPVDKERAMITSIQRAPQDAYGTSGVRMVVKVTNMLEGFRRGHVLRVFGPGWPVKDQSYGESLMGYGYARLQDQELMELPPKEYPRQFPFRTDYGNEQLSWFKIESDEPPPRYSEHLVFGEMVKADAAARAGQFRMEKTGEVVDFTLLPKGTVQYLNAAASLADLPPGTRGRFSMYQDEKGAFTRASLVRDEFSNLASNGLTLRVEALRLAEGKLNVARQMAEVKNYNGDMERPPDIGRTELRVTPETKVWKGAAEVKLGDLAVGDALLVNTSSEQPGAPAHCTEIWVGAETHKLVSERQGRKLVEVKK